MSLSRSASQLPLPEAALNATHSLDSLCCPGSEFCDSPLLVSSYIYIYIKLVHMCVYIYLLYFMYLYLLCILMCVWREKERERERMLYICKMYSTFLVVLGERAVQITYSTNYSFHHYKRWKFYNFF